MRTYKNFVRASSNYLSRADEAALSLHHELTLGCWVWFDPESTGVETGIISKWYDVGIQKSYVLYKDANNVIHFKVSDDGTTEYDVNNLGAAYQESQWFYVVGRFNPDVEMALFINGMWYINRTSVPSTIFNDSEDFEIGRYNRDNYLDGRVSQAFISEYSIPDVFICQMYFHSKALYMDIFSYANPCSSSSSSTSSSTSSSSSTTSSSSSTEIP